jgi:hypothetical protein
MVMGVQCLGYFCAMGYALDSIIPDGEGPY